MNNPSFVPFQEYLKSSMHCKKKRSENRARKILSLYRVKNSRVLEIGCGPGFLITELSELSSGNDFFAMDTDHEALEWLIKHGGDFHPLIHCVQNEAYSFPFQNSLFDLIVSEECLHSLDFFPFVMEIIRILKPGGKAILIDINIRSPLFKLIKLKKLFLSYLKISSLTSFDQAFIHAVSKGYKKENLQEKLKLIKYIDYTFTSSLNWHYIEISKNL